MGRDTARRPVVESTDGEHTLGGGSYSVRPVGTGTTTPWSWATDPTPTMG